MNVVFRKFQASLSQQAFVLNRALPFCRTTPSILQVPAWAPTNERQHSRMPTHGIGRWRFMFKKKPQRKKKAGHKTKPNLAPSASSYGSVNVQMSGYDMTAVEYFSQYVHLLCNRLRIKVSETYALPTSTTEVMVMPERSTKMFSEAVLRTHSRVIQLRDLSTTLCPVLLDVLLKHQPEGVQLSLKKHTQDQYKARFKSRPELQELLEKLKYKK